MPNGLDETRLELNRELWIWRTFGILLMLGVLVTDVISYISDKDLHKTEALERNKAWLKIENITISNGEKIMEVHTQISACVKCHVHPIDLGVMPKSK